MLRYLVKGAKVYSEPWHTSKVKFFAKIFSSCKPLTIFSKALSYVFDRALNTSRWCLSNWVSTS